MKRFLMVTALILSLMTTPVFADDISWRAEENAADFGYNETETEIYIDGYEDGYEEGYAVAEEKYDRTFFYEYIPGIWLGLLLYSAYQYFTGKDR